MADAGLRHEELGKRGCATKDLSTLDADLEARYVTTEELSLALSAKLRDVHSNRRCAPCTWWDRSCDIGLLVGTFIHGFGNYEAMRNDEELPFAKKIRRQDKLNEACIAAYISFHAAARMARVVFGNALDSARSKAQEEAHAVVAAAMAASKVAEEENNSQSGAEIKPSSDALEALQSNGTDLDDTHLVTLSRLSNSMVSAARTEATRSRTMSVDEGHIELVKSIRDPPDDGQESIDEIDRTEKELLPPHQRLPMPDARVLDNLLVQLIDRLEGEITPQYRSSNGSSGIEWDSGKDVIVHEEARCKALSVVVGLSEENISEERRDFSGIGLNGAQCATTHRSLDDGSDFSVGAASAELSYVATGNDAPRYLRALGVPMNITRYAASALMYADGATLETMLSEERIRNSIEDEDEVGEKDAILAVSADPKPEKVGSESPVDPVARIVMAPEFRENASLRAGICATVLHYGYTTVGSSNAHVNAAISSELERHLPSSDKAHPKLLFSVDNFSSAAASLMDQTNMPSSDALKQYVEFILLPYCLRLCVMGNGPTTRNARESKGRFETAFGINEYPDYTKPRQSPLPDPCGLLADQSIEAVACASAILRRTRLMRAAQHIVSGGVPLDRLKEILQSDIMLNSMQDLPIWWCPEIHDLGLLVHAATRGLFTILGDRKDGITGSVFSPEAIMHHIRTRVVSDKVFPKHLLASTSPDDISAWVQEQSQQFLSANALERRLALLCEQATADMGSSSTRYDNLPMFDHGGYPR